MNRIKFIILTIILFLPFLFYLAYYTLREKWLIYATFISFGIGVILLLFLTILLIYRSREDRLLTKLEVFTNKQKIKIDDNYFCPSCKKIIEKNTCKCPNCGKDLD